MNAQKTDITVADCMTAAWIAILRGDLVERDKLIAMVERAMQGREFINGNESVLVTTKDD